MLHHIRAVARGSHAPLLVADLPFGTYLASPEDAIRNAVRMVREGGADALKLEGGLELVDTVRRLTSVGIPVMAHVGLLPQRHVMLSGYRLQGRDADAALNVLKSALALEAALVLVLVESTMEESEDAGEGVDGENDEVVEAAEELEAAKSAVWDFSAELRWACTPAMSARRYTELARIAVPDASSNAPSSSA